MLLEAFAVLEIDSEQAVSVAHRYRGPLPVKIPLYAHSLLLGAVQVGDIGKGDIARDLLFQRQAGGGQVVGGVESGVDVDATSAEKALETIGELLRNRLSQ